MMPSGVDRLAWILNLIEPKCRPGQSVWALSGEESDTAVAATALLRAAIVQAREIYDLRGKPGSEASSVNARSLLEAFAELHWLLTQGDALRNARKMLIFSVRELEKAVSADPSLSIDLQLIRNELARLAQVDPQAFNEVDNQINRAKSYWTGQTRTTIVRAALGWVVSHDKKSGEALAKQAYKLLSWEDHHVMAILSYVNTGADQAGGPHVKVALVQEGSDDFNAEFGAGLLASCWFLYVERFTAAA